MKGMSRWLSYTLFIVLVLCEVLSKAALQTMAAGGGSYLDSLKAGVELIWEAEPEPDESSVTDERVNDEDTEEETEEIEDTEEPAAEDISEEETEEADLLVMADVNNSLNVRAEASTEAEIVGLLYADSSAELLEEGDGWSKIQSGNLIGWANNDYLLFGEEARERALEVGDYRAVSLTGGLRVRKEASLEAGVYGLLDEGEVVEVYEELDEWVEVNFDGYTGYVSAEYVSVTFELNEGETMEEIAAREAAEAEARARAAAEAEQRRANREAEKAYVSANYTEQQILGALIWCEAGNQCYDGLVAVGAVVMNRVNSPGYPNTIVDVIYAPGQFTPALRGKISKVLERGVNATCLQAAQDAMNGVNNVGSATHFNGVGTHDGLIIQGHVFW